MNDFVIITDTGCDLPIGKAAELGVDVLTLPAFFDSKPYDSSNDPDFKNFYSLMRSGKRSTTSALNVEQVFNAVDPLMREGKDVLYLTLSSGLSGTYNAARLAAEDLAAKHPDRRFIAVDSLAASLGFGLLVYLAVKQKNSGKSIDEVAQWIEDNRNSIAHYFTVDDLVYLKRGGRVSAATALVGTIIGVKPVLHVDDEGHLIKIGQERGRKASLNRLVSHMEETAVSPADQIVFISHADCEEDALYIRDEITRRMGVRNFLIDSIGPTVGAHSGPGTIALFFIAEHK